MAEGAEGGRGLPAAGQESAPAQVPASVWQALEQGPAALWCLSRPGGAVQWASDQGHAMVAASASTAAALGDWVRGESAPAPGWAPWAELARQALASVPGGRCSRGWLRLVQGLPQLWQLDAQVLEQAVVLMAMQVDEAAAYSVSPQAVGDEQRDRLVREVHHRLQNNLQGVCGLLRQQASLHPQAAPWLDAAASQLQTMAEVHGLQTRGASTPAVAELVRAVAGHLASRFGVVIEVRESVQGPPESPGPLAPDAEPDASPLRRTLWAHLMSPPGGPALQEVTDSVHPDQAGALALVLNELVTHAVEQGTPPAAAPGAAPQAAVRCSVTRRGAIVEVEIANVVPAWVPSAPQRLNPGVQGLGLAQALLPSQGAELLLHAHPGMVCARLQISHPVLCRRV